jgi:hypothetical protein
VKFKKYIFGLAFLDVMVLLAGFLLSVLAATTLKFSDVIVLTLCFSAITFLSLLIFHRGLKKEPVSQTMHILVAMVIKMLLEMFLALFWFIVAKKTVPSTLLLFFVLYLAFTLYSIIFMLNTLKRKSL